MKRIVLIIVFAIAFHGYSQYQPNTKVSGKSSNKLLGNLNKTGVLTANSKHRPTALSKLKKKQKKFLATKATKSFKSKVADNYKPKSGKLHRTITVQRPFFNEAYIEYPLGRYEPYRKTLQLSGTPYALEADLLVKFKVKQGRSYLLRLKFKTDVYDIEGANAISTASMFASLGDSWSAKPLEMSNGRLAASDYVFDVIISSETNGWIQVPYVSGVEGGSWKSIIPWNFKSVTVSEL